MFDCTSRKLWLCSLTRSQRRSPHCRMCPLFSTLCHLRRCTFTNKTRQTRSLQTYSEYITSSKTYTHTHTDTLRIYSPSKDCAIRNKHCSRLCALSYSAAFLFLLLLFFLCLFPVSVCSCTFKENTTTKKNSHISFHILQINTRESHKFS